MYLYSLSLNGFIIFLVSNPLTCVILDSHSFSIFLSAKCLFSQLLQYILAQLYCFVPDYPIQPFNKHLLSTSYPPDVVLGIVGALIDSMASVSDPMELLHRSKIQRQTNKQ